MTMRQQLPEPPQDKTFTTGIDVRPPSDEDVPLVAVSVTGSPAVSWDESQDQFSVNKGLDVTDGAVTFDEDDDGNSGDAVTIDWSSSNKHRVTLTDDATLTFTAPPGQCNLLLVVVQDGTGSREITWPSTVQWPGGSAPTLTTTADAIDIISLYYDGTNYYANSSLNFS